VTGIDVSRYQAQINWTKVADTGLDFAFVKATEGGDHQDELFSTNWNALELSGIRRGAYHFYRPAVNPKLQAENFFTTVGHLTAGDLPPVLDVETRGKTPSSEFVDDIKTWLLLAEARYGAKPILYTGQNFYNRFLAGHFPDYPVWIARYKKETPSLADGRAFQFWQFSDKGKLPGIDGHVDVNVFTGTALELAILSIPLRINSDEAEALADN
jgi:lysozyme